MTMFEPAQEQGVLIAKGVKVCDEFCRRRVFFNELVHKCLSETSLDPDQTRHFVWIYLDPNCSQRLSADSKSGLQQGRPVKGACTAIKREARFPVFYSFFFYFGLLYCPTSHECQSRHVLFTK